MHYFQSEATAARRRLPLYLVDATDGITPETGESGGQPQLSKAGGAWTNTTATLVSLGNGGYYVELTGTELNTLGPIQWRYKSANTAEFQLAATVVPANVLADMVAVSGDSTAADNLEAQYDGTGYANTNAPATQGVLATVQSDAAAGQAALPTATRDAILNFALRSGRTIRGHLRRMDALFFGKATGLLGALATLFQPDGSTTEFTAAQDTTAGTRDTATVTNSEVP